MVIDNCIATLYSYCVIKTFSHRGLKRAYERDDYRQVHPNYAKRIAKALSDLDNATKPSDLDAPTYRLHPLRGDLKEFWSIRISKNWRIIFRFDDGGHVCDADLIDYH